MHFKVTFLSVNVLKRVRMKAKHISIALNLIRLHALASLSRIEAKHVKLTSFSISQACFAFIDTNLCSTRLNYFELTMQA